MNIYKVFQTRFEGGARIDELAFMTWPRKFEQSNNRVTLNILKEMPLEIGDKIQGNPKPFSDTDFSTWVVARVEKRRASNMEKMDHVTIVCDWGWQPWQWLPKENEG